MRASQVGFTPVKHRTVDTTKADQRLAEIRQEAADRDAANKADHKRRVSKIEAERIAFNEERQAERDAVELERITASLRSAYMLQPGATESNFKAALPKLLEERRQQDAAEQVSQSRQFTSSRIRRLI